MRALLKSRPGTNAATFHRADAFVSPRFGSLHATLSQLSGFAPSPSVTELSGPRIHSNRARRSACSATAKKPATYFYREPSSWPTAEEIPLKAHDLDQLPYVDLIVAGAGPSGIVVAERVAQVLGVPPGIMMQAMRLSHDTLNGIIANDRP